MDKKDETDLFRFIVIVLLLMILWGCVLIRHRQQPAIDLLDAMEDAEAACMLAAQKLEQR
jgi:hypothetical protein